ncbi:MAG: long-chain-fatty-acid--CoA ligase [Panacagrimonas sp.]
MWLYSEIRSHGDIPRHYARTTPNAPALIGAQGPISWKELDLRTNRIAHALQGLGARAGDRVAILCKNTPMCLEAMFGANKIDATLLPLNWRLAAPELAAVLEDGRPRVLIADREYAETAKKIAPSASGDCRVVLYDADAPGTSELDALIAKASAEDPGVEVNPWNSCILMYTSGTTGRPKGVQQSHQGHLFLRLCEHLEPSFQYRPTDRMLTVMPLFHAMGLSLSLQALYNGVAVATYPMPDPVQLSRLITEVRPTVLPLVPTAVQMLVDHPETGAADLSYVRMVIYAGSSITVPVLQRAIKRLGCEFIQFYGATETSCGVTFLRPKDHRLDDELRLKSCGAPLPLVDIRVVDGEDNEVPVGQVGEFLIRSPSLSTGYHNQPETTAVAFRGGWYHSGDAGYRDAEGLLYIVDRVKDMIVSGGENVYSTEVEQAVQKLDGVQLCAAVGLPDLKWGERVTVAIVCRPEAQITDAQVIAHCRELIAGYKVPKQVIFVDALPMTPSGKVMKKTLREQLANAGAMAG